MSQEACLGEPFAALASGTVDAEDTLALPSGDALVAMQAPGPGLGVAARAVIQASPVVLAVR